MPFAISDGAVTEAAQVVHRKLARAMATAAKSTIAKADDDTGITSDPELTKALSTQRDALRGHQAIKAVQYILVKLGAAGLKLPVAQEHALSFRGALRWAPTDAITTDPLGLQLFIADAAYRKGVMTSVDGLLDNDGKPVPLVGDEATQYLTGLRGFFGLPAAPTEVSPGVFVLELRRETVARIRSGATEAVLGEPELCWGRDNTLTPHADSNTAARVQTAGRRVLIPQKSGDGYKVATVGGWGKLEPLPAPMRDDFAGVLDSLRLSTACDAVTSAARSHWPKRPVEQCESAEVHAELVCGGGGTWTSTQEFGGDLGLFQVPQPSKASALTMLIPPPEFNVLPDGLDQPVTMAKAGCAGPNCIVLTTGKLRIGRHHHPDESIVVGMHLCSSEAADVYVPSTDAIPSLWPRPAPQLPAAVAATQSPPQPAGGRDAQPAQDETSPADDVLNALQKAGVTLPPEVTVHLAGRDKRAKYTEDCGTLGCPMQSPAMQRFHAATHSVQKWRDERLRDCDQEIWQAWCLNHHAGYVQWLQCSSVDPKSGYRIFDTKKAAAWADVANEALPDDDKCTVDQVAADCYGFNTESWRLQSACRAVARLGGTLN
eukprot:gene2643-3705_t